MEEVEKQLADLYDRLDAISFMPISAAWILEELVREFGIKNIELVIRDIASQQGKENENQTD